jgi:hypothetical protein
MVDTYTFRGKLSEVAKALGGFERVFHGQVRHVIISCLSDGNWELVVYYQTN